MLVGEAFAYTANPPRGAGNDDSPPFRASALSTLYASGTGYVPTSFATACIRSAVAAVGAMVVTFALDEPPPRIATSQTTNPIASATAMTAPTRISWRRAQGGR